MHKANGMSILILAQYGARGNELKKFMQRYNMLTIARKLYNSDKNRSNVNYLGYDICQSIHTFATQIELSLLNLLDELHGDDPYVRMIPFDNNDLILPRKQAFSGMSKTIFLFVKTKHIFFVQVQYQSHINIRMC